jgi:hypothetical protein
MHKKPERVAWTVLWTAFILFCLLVTSIPLSIRYYLLNSMVDQETQLQRIEGTILVQEAKGNRPYPVTGSALLSPGDEVILDATSRATLDFFDRSHITLYSNTNVELEQVQAPRFGMSKQPNHTVLNLRAGLARVGVALPGERDTDFQVITPHTTLSLAGDGSFRIEVTNETTQITVIRGQASLGSESLADVLHQGTRTRVDLTGMPANPLSAAENLIENGDFQEPLGTGWLTSTVVLTSTVQAPYVEIVEDGGRTAAHLVQLEVEDGEHTEVAIQQRLNQDVRDFDRLEVSADIRLDFQSLSGGGLLSSEFPIIVRLDYKDLWGNDKFWTHGFYYQNQANYPVALDPWGRPSGEQVPHGVWYPYESGNLLNLLGENKPARITGLTIYASGWKYDGMVSEIHLIVE